MKKKRTKAPAGTGDTAAPGNGGSDGGAMGRARGDGKAEGARGTPRDYPEGGRPNGDPESGETSRETPEIPKGAGEDIDGGAAGAAAPDDAVFRDIMTKAAEGNIKYQELYLKYIDLISGKMVDENEVIYEATFIDDEDQEA